MVYIIWSTRDKMKGDKVTRLTQVNVQRLREVDPSINIAIALLYERQRLDKRLEIIEKDIKRIKDILDRV